MKKFKSLVHEWNASDYKPNMQDDAQGKGEKSSSKGEENFKAQHKKAKKPHPVATDAQFSGGTKSVGMHKGFENEPGERGPLKTYAQFAKMGAFGQSSYRATDNKDGEKKPVMQGSSKKKVAESITAIPHRVVLQYDHPSGKGTAVIRKVVHAQTKQGAGTKAAQASSRSGKRNVKVVRVTPWHSALGFSGKKIDEAFKPGPMKLNDGNTIRVKDDQAAALNKFFSGMGPGEKSRFAKEVMKNKAKFTQIVGFASAGQK